MNLQETLMALFNTAPQGGGMAGVPQEGEVTADIAVDPWTRSQMSTGPWPKSLGPSPSPAIEAASRMPMLPGTYGGNLDPTHGVGVEDDTIPTNARPTSGQGFGAEVASMFANDPPADTSVRRTGRVMPGPRNWGDAEAEAAGLYETPGSPQPQPQPRPRAQAQAAPGGATNMMDVLHGMFAPGPDGGGSPLPFAGEGGGGEPGVAPVPMPRPRPPQADMPQTAAAIPGTEPPLPPYQGRRPRSGVTEGGPYNSGPAGDPYAVAPGMWGPGVSPQQAPGGMGNTLANAIRDAMFGAAAVNPSDPAIKAVATGYAGSQKATEGRAELARKTARENRQDDQKELVHEDNMDYRYDALATGGNAWVPGMGPGPDGTMVPGTWKQNSKDGTRSFEPGTSITSRAGAAGITQPARVKIAQAYVDANRAARAANPALPELTMQEALDRAGRSPRDAQDRATLERLASAAARAEQQAHSSDPRNARTPFDMGGRLNHWRQFYGIDAQTSGAPATRQPGTTPAPRPRTQAPADIDSEGTIAAARAAIARRPEARDAIIQRLEENGITDHGL